MPAKYDTDVKATAVRLVRDDASDYETVWAAILAIRPIQCGPVRARLSLGGTAVPHPAKFYGFTCRWDSARLDTLVSV